MPRNLWMALLAACAVAASGCEKDEPEAGPAPVKPEDPEDPPVDPPPPPEPPVWESRVDWIGRGHRTMPFLLSSDLDGDGAAELVLGSHRPTVLSASGDVLWNGEWEPENDNPNMFGDGEVVASLNAIPNGSGNDLLVGTPNGQAYLFGADGTKKWRINPEIEFRHAALVPFGGEDDPRFFARTGYAAYSARTGEVAWESPVPLWPSYIVEASQGVDAPTGLFLGCEMGSSAGFGLEAGEEPPAFDGSNPTIHSLTADGELLWSVEFTDGAQIIALGAADLDGNGQDSAVAGFFNGMLRAYDPQGALRWEQQLAPFGDPSNTFYRSILAEDADGDGKDEIFVVAYDPFAQWGTPNTGTVLAFDSEGRKLWQQVFDQHGQSASIVGLNGQRVLLLGGGSDDFIDYGEVRVLQLGADVAAEERNILATQTLYQVQSVTVQAGAEGDVLVIGGSDGVIRFLDGASGATLRERYLSGQVGLVAALHADGEDLLVGGDAYGRVFVLDAKGQPVWNRRMEVGKYGWVQDLAIADLEGTGEESVIAIAPGYHQAGVGSLEAWSAKGSKLFGVRIPSLPWAMETADLDGDGDLEIVVVEAEREPMGDCRLLYFDHRGTPLSEMPIARCEGATLATGDTDGDGIDEIVVHTWPTSDGLTPPFLSYVEGIGPFAWMLDESTDITLWLKVVPGGILHGGNSMSWRGFVTFRDVDTGTWIWSSTLRSYEDPETPDFLPVSGSSFYSALVPDLDGDGVDEVAVSTIAREIYLLDGATGAERWAMTTGSIETPSGFRHIGGPLAYVPASGELPAHLVHAPTTDWTLSRPSYRSSLEAISLDGDLISTIPTRSCGESIAVIEADGKHGAVVGAGMGIYAISPYEVSER